MFKKFDYNKSLKNLKIYFNIYKQNSAAKFMLKDESGKKTLFFKSYLFFLLYKILDENFLPEFKIKEALKKKLINEVD